MKNLKHQDDALAKSEGMKGFAYFMDPGTGKTRVTLLDAARLHQRGLLDAMVILAPNSVKTSWVTWPHLLEEGEKDQVSTHLGDANVLKGVWFADNTGPNIKAWRAFEREIDNNKGRLIVVSLNYDALRNNGMIAFLTELMKGYRTMLVADESTRIGIPGSERTKRALMLSKMAVYRRILSGTPIIKSPLKLFTQFKFLGEDTLPFGSYYAFRNRFAIMGGFEGKQILGYRNLEQLSAFIEPYTFRITKEECLDLPPAIYVKRTVQMGPAQIKAYQEMRQEFLTNVDGTDITANIVLTQLIRLQQITGGYVQQDGKAIPLIQPRSNPKFQAVLDIVNSHDKQTIIWCNWRAEIAGLADLLKEEKITFYEFHGDIPDGERVSIRKGFERGLCQVLLGTQGTGGIGIDEFKVAPVMIFVSNDFDTEKRVQAEGRNMRIGSEIHPNVTYYDVVCANTVDTKILRVFRNNAEISAKILKDNWREWI